MASVAPCSAGLSNCAVAASVYIGESAEKEFGGFAQRPSLVVAQRVKHRHGHSRAEQDVAEDAGMDAGSLRDIAFAIATDGDVRTRSFQRDRTERFEQHRADTVATMRSAPVATPAIAPTTPCAAASAPRKRSSHGTCVRQRRGVGRFACAHSSSTMTPRGSVVSTMRAVCRTPPQATTIRRRRCYTFLRGNGEIYFVGLVCSASLRGNGTAATSSCRAIASQRARRLPGPARVSSSKPP